MIFSTGNATRDITNILIAIQAVITLLITFRSFTFYFRTRTGALLTLGLAMGVIGIGGVTGVIDDPFLHANPTYNTVWFRFAGQIVGFLFIFLASLATSTRYTEVMQRWHYVAVVLLLALMFLTPVIPVRPNPTMMGALSIARFVVSMMVFFSYLAIFFSKGTRFSLLMTASFLISSIGFWIYAMKYFIPGGSLTYDFLADSIRIVGLIVLYITFIAG